MRVLKGIAVWFILIMGATTASANQGIIEGFDYSNPEFKATIDMLSMEGHGNDDFSSCNVVQLYYQEVAEMFEKGMTKKQILDYYVDEQGIAALKAPPKKGFNLTLWVTPYLMIIVFSVILYFLFKKWKKNNSTSTIDEAQQSFDIEDEIYSSLIDEERKKFI